MRLWTSWMVSGLLAVCVLVVGCGPATFVVGVTPGDRELTETVVVNDRGWRTRVAMIDVSGVITNGRQDGLFMEGINPVAELHEKLARAARDDRVCAVVLRINSPGGTVTASEAMHGELVRFRERTGKPVVVAMMDVAASGGYYLACGADRIVAYPSTVTGSIGVIMQTVSLKPAMDRIGVEATTIRSGPIKGAGSPLMEMTQEQRAVFQGMIDAFHEQFVSVVDAGRSGLSRAEVKKLADGRVYTGEQAAEVGLIDGLGDIYSAYADAKRLAGVKHADLVLYHRPLDYVASPYAMDPSRGTGSGETTINLLSLRIDRSSLLGSPVTFGYLWTVDGLE
ncbi:signal peptide peptidase SppA [Mucisphaera calidilacus]|uniref:Signal peptide peptidase SppA n=1 Tax=Mucisphaera calidilacus TaxID=2527982 RepID=A0A518BXZ6_9BACT|nr:signal peptide peptidase SppA [Mucisphaera calidilacus]QDU71857.1 Putative signal peptide peptidase SppA [Mucisphaera calidilacus]